MPYKIIFQVDFTEGSYSAPGPTTIRYGSFTVTDDAELSSGKSVHNIDDAEAWFCEFFMNTTEDKFVDCAGIAFENLSAVEMKINTSGLWSFGDYDVFIVFAGDTDDLTMEVSATFANGVIDYNLESYKNSGEEPTSTSFSGEENFVLNGKIETAIERFVESLAPKNKNIVITKDEKIPQDREDLLNALKIGTISLEDVDDNLRADRDVAFVALKYHLWLIDYFSDRATARRSYCIAFLICSW